MSFRIQGICGIRRGNGEHVVEVGTETVSPGRKIDRRVAGGLDQAVGLMTCVLGLFSRSAKPATAAGIDAGDSSRSRKVERRSGGCDKTRDERMTLEQTHCFFFQHTTHKLT